MALVKLTHTVGFKHAFRGGTSVANARVKVGCPESQVFSSMKSYSYIKKIYYPPLTASNTQVVNDVNVN